MGEPEFELNPPLPVDVARRAAILKYQFIRVATTPPEEIVAHMSAAWSPADRDAFHATLERHRTDIVDALRADGLWEDSSLSERRIFECPASALTMQQRVNTSWRAEALGCLAWALGLMESLPAYDTQMDPERIVPLIPLEAASFIGATLRPHSEIETAREVAELWHWRSRTRRLLEEGRSPREELDSIVRGVAPRASEGGMIGPPIGEDFPAFGKAYRELTPEEWASAQSIAMERHFALNWLCGFAPDNEWDETPTDT